MKAFIYSFVLFALLAVALAEIICPAKDGEYVVHRRNPDDCSTFFKCSEGVPVIQDCPAGLLYNAPLGVCDWAENVDCSLPDSE